MSSKVYKNICCVNCIFSCFGGLIKPKYQLKNNKIVEFNDEVEDNILKNENFLDFLKEHKKEHKNKCLYITPCEKEKSDDVVLKEHFGEYVEGKKVIHLKNFKYNIVCYMLDTYSFSIQKKNLRNNCIYW